MLLFSKIYEFYCLYGIEILLSGATGAAHQNSYEGLHIFSYKALFPNCSHFLPLFLNSSYEGLFTILLTRYQLNSVCTENLMDFVSCNSFVYKIPYRRARAWPSGCIGRVRRASKGILHTKCARDQRNLAYKQFVRLATTRVTSPAALHPTLVRRLCVKLD